MAVDRDLQRRTYLIPNMADHAHALAAAMTAFGLHAEVLPPPDENTALVGAKVTLGRECMPCLLVAGDILSRARQPGFDPTQYGLFITTSNGPCRFGQYQMLYRQILDEHGLEEMAIVGPNAENEYMGFGDRPGALRRLAWDGLIAVDLLQQARHHVRPYETESGATDRVYWSSVEAVCANLRSGGKGLRDALAACAAEFDKVPVDRSVSRPLIGIVGEIYARLNYFANRDLIRTIERLGGEATLASIMEWGYYTNWHFSALMAGLGRQGHRLNMSIANSYQRLRELRLRGPLAHLIRTGPETNPGKLVDYMRRYGSAAIDCETVMTVGKAADMAAEGADGLINVMPFSCMAGIIASGLSGPLRRDYNNIPWLDLAFDLQLTTNLQTRLEAFMYQAAHRHSLRQHAAA